MIESRGGFGDGRVANPKNLNGKVDKHKYRQHHPAVSV